MNGENLTPSHMEQLLLGIILLIAGIVLLVIGLLPSLIAFNRKHQYRWPILIINVFLGWTLIGYVVALVWAVMPQGKLS